MRVEPFGLGQRDRRRREAPQLLGAELEDRGALHEVEHRQAGREARRARGRQHVVGAADIVADRLRRVAAEEDRAGIADAATGSLRRRRCASSTCSAAMRSTSGTASSRRFDDDDRAEIAPARRSRLGRAAALAAARSTAASTASPNAGVVGDQDRLRRRVVLGLRQQVGGDPVRDRCRRRRRPALPTGRRSCRCRPCRTPAAWRPRHRHCRARRSWRPAGSSRCRRRARRSPARRRRGRSRDTPARSAATSTSGLISPPGAGTAMTTRSTPATLAGTAFISTELG